jgi:hypothetical protein
MKDWRNEEGLVGSNDMGALSDMEVAELADQALASLNARFTDVEHPKVPHGRCPICGHYGDDCEGDEISTELAVAIRRACDEWDRFADALPNFRES